MAKSSLILRFEKRVYNPLASRIHTIITDKTLKKARLKELRTTLHQRGYPTTLIDKGLELPEKILRTK